MIFIKTQQILTAAIIFFASSVGNAETLQAPALSSTFKETFEKNIGRLFYVSSDGTNVFDPYGKIIDSVDIDARKVFFSEEGWTEYKDYLKERQEGLKKNLASPSHSMTESGSVRKDTARYFTNPDGEMILEADIFMSTKSYDVLGMGGRRRLTISFRAEDADDASKAVITRWQATPGLASSPYSKHLPRQDGQMQK